MFTDIFLLAKSTLGTTPAVVYTAPVGKKAQIGTLLFHSKDTPAVLEIWITGTADGDKLMKVSLAENETYEFSPKVPITLAGEETISMASSVATTINAFILGRTEI